MTLVPVSQPLTVDPETVMKTGLAAWQVWERLQKPLKNLRGLIKKNDVCIVVFGPGGVGKTTLGKALSKEFDPGAKPKDYQESMGKETYTLRFDPARKVIVAPGQEQRLNRYWPDLLSEVTRAKTVVFCNVVSFGYHSPNAEDYVSVSSEQAIANYLAEQRQREQDIAVELANLLEKTKVSIKMLTLVTKQDLWWKEQATVEKHYGGEYAMQIKRIQSAKGSQHFVHETVYTSLYLHNLISPNGQIIGLTTEGYDDAIRFESQRKAFEVIEKFVKDP